MEPSDPWRGFAQPPEGDVNAPKEVLVLGFGTSIFLIALGAILAFAVTAEVAGLDIEVVRLDPDDRRDPRARPLDDLPSSWGGPGYWSRRRETYVDDRRADSGSAQLTLTLTRWTTLLPMPW